MHPTPLPTQARIRNFERRAWPRFERRVRVLLMPDDCALEEPYGAWIVNASRTGVRLSIRKEDIAEGTILRIRKPLGTVGRPWVSVKVKNFSRKDGTVELGCEFVQSALEETSTLFN